MILEENPVFAQGSSLATWQRHEKSPLFKIIMTYPPLGNGIPSFICLDCADHAQKAPVVTWNRKIYKPGDYPSIVDLYQGDQKTIVSKSKSLVPPF